jgi:hypothetical protein
MGKLEELGWIGLALGAQRVGHARGEKLASYAAELDWIEEEIWRIRQDLLERYYEVTSGHEEPESARGLVLKKFLVALADEDVCSRLYAYGEKLYQLLNMAFLIGARSDGGSTTRTDSLRRRSLRSLDARTGSSNRRSSTGRRGLCQTSYMSCRSSEPPCVEKCVTRWSEEG